MSDDGDKKKSYDRPAAVDAIRGAKQPVFSLLLTPLIAGVVLFATILFAWLRNL
jgi:hypothetical protein